VWRRIAAHEAGHAVVAALGGRVVLIRLLLAAPSRRGETVWYLPDPWLHAVACLGAWAATPERYPIDDYAAAVRYVGEERIREAADLATAIVREHQATVIAVAEALILSGGHLTGARVAELTAHMTPAQR
jgi:hypothetical protein